MSIAELTEHRNVAREALLVDCSRRRRSLRSCRQGNVPARDRFAKRLAHFRLPTRELEWKLDARREEPMIHGSQLDTHPRPADQSFGGAVARHASDHR